MSKAVYGVCDTNVLISGILTAGTSAQVLDHFLLSSNAQLVFSEATAAELSEVLMRHKFDRYIGREKRHQVLDEILMGARFVSPQGRLKLCRDPKDDKFLDVAAMAPVSILITGDQDLLVLETIEQISIVNPADFLRLLSH